MRLRSSLLTFLCGALTAGCPPADQGARSVILFVGDGLGAGQVALGIQYARRIEGRQLNLEQ